jgi:phosphoribosylamine---glycine ligase
MNILILGSGGREHALAWKIAASPLTTKLYCAPGNAGIVQEAECIGLDPADHAAVIAFAREKKIDLVVVGPEAPLCAGIVDHLEAAGIKVFGPNKWAARLEGSKGFTKDLCKANGIPTADYKRFKQAAAAKDYVRAKGTPIVVKADGLAAGKGVVVASSVAEAESAIDMMFGGGLGQPAWEIVIEDCLVGEEASFFALCDGETAIPLASAQDHKRVGDGDTGPNTGGMGSYSPTPSFPPALQDAAMDGIIRPALAEMARRGTPFRGILYAGLMLTNEGVKLIEFNVRFGDPECQALVLRLHSDLLPALQAAYDGELQNFDLRWNDVASIAVVMAARGYPDAPERGSEIGGLDRAAAVPNVQIFHAGTAQDTDGRIRVAGGRVLTVCATGATLTAAHGAAYAAVQAIDWPEGICRRDIGRRALGTPS